MTEQSVIQIISQKFHSKWLSHYTNIESNKFLKNIGFLSGITISTFYSLYFSLSHHIFSLFFISFFSYLTMNLFEKINSIKYTPCYMFKLEQEQISDNNLNNNIYKTFMKNKPYLEYYTNIAVNYNNNNKNEVEEPICYINTILFILGIVFAYFSFHFKILILIYCLCYYNHYNKLINKCEEHNLNDEYKEFLDNYSSITYNVVNNYYNEIDKNHMIIYDDNLKQLVFIEIKKEVSSQIKHNIFTNFNKLDHFSKLNSNDITLLSLIINTAFKEIIEENKLLRNNEVFSDKSKYSDENENKCTENECDTNNDCKECNISLKIEPKKNLKHSKSDSELSCNNDIELQENINLSDKDANTIIVTNPVYKRRPYNTRHSSRN